MLDSNAQKKICPFIQEQSMEVTIHDPKNIYCITKKCMAWDTSIKNLRVGHCRLIYPEYFMEEL